MPLHELELGRMFPSPGIVKGSPYILNDDEWALICAKRGHKIGALWIEGMKVFLQSAREFSHPKAKVAIYGMCSVKTLVVKAVAYGAGSARLSHEYHSFGGKASSSRRKLTINLEDETIRWKKHGSLDIINKDEIFEWVRTQMAEIFG